MTKIVHISDTHGCNLSNLNIPECDILVHSGDLTNVGEIYQVVEIFEWFRKQKARHIVFIAGNHDRSFDLQFCRDWKKEEVYHRVKTLIDDLSENIHYLENSSVIINDIKFWGSPITPDFFPQSWAFNKPRGKEIKKIWGKIPKDTDVLITHGPPKGILDETITFIRTGCEELLKVVSKSNNNIRLHLFGHIHEAYGDRQFNGISFSNASILDEKYRIRNNPRLFTI